MDMRDTAVVFIHGYLDDPSLWEAVATTAGPAVAISPRLGWEGPIGLESFADAVEAAVEELGPARSVVLVGHSMGAQVAELVAGRLAGRVAGLALLAPVPLGGLALPVEVSGPLRGCGENPDVQRALRTQLSVGLDEAGLERLVGIGTGIPSALVEAAFDAWSTGSPDAAARPAPDVPTLILAGVGDPFVNDDVLGLVTARLPHASVRLVPDAGHWPHVENPGPVAAELVTFVSTLADA